MERVCFQLRVRPEMMTEYKSRHEAVWPDMLQALRETGWTNYSLFLSDDGLLIGYLETDDFAASLMRMQEKEVNSRWQLEMAPYFESTGSLLDGSGFHRLEEVFHLE